MRCEMCGKDTQLFIAEVEGSDINVCVDCAKFGKILRRVSAPVKEKNKKTGAKTAAEEPEIVEMIVEGYGNIVKNKREKLNLTQKDLATRLAEKETLIQKIETEKFEPPISLAKKLEKFLAIKLIEEVKETNVQIQKNKSSTFTLGDFVKVRKRKS